MISKATVQSLFEQEVRLTPDIVVSVTFEKQSNWDESTQSANIDVETVDEAVKTSVETSEINGDTVQSGDFRLRFLVDELTFVPKSNTFFNINGVRGKVIITDTDPTVTLYFLLCRLD